MFHADLHIHSKYSRACSKDCDIEHLSWWALRKGLTRARHRRLHPPGVGGGAEGNPGPGRARPVPGPAGPGRAGPARFPASCAGTVRFMLSVEISTIYRRDERTRKVHHLHLCAELRGRGPDHRGPSQDRQPGLGRPADSGPGLPRPAGHHAVRRPGLLSGARARVDAVVRGPRLEIRLRRGAGLLRAIWPGTYSRWRRACPRIRR